MRGYCSDQPHVPTTAATARVALIFRKTGNPETVRQLLGHSSLSNTLHYLNVSAETAVRMGREIEV